MTLPLRPLLENAIQSRSHLIATAGRASAFRIFNGFTEGLPDLSLDLYSETLVFHNRHADASVGRELVEEANSLIQNHARLSQRISAGLMKCRNGRSSGERRGILLFGRAPDHKIQEHGVSYAVDLTLNQDSSFYLDTSNLRKWLMENLQGRSVLNTFAYTGSLGVAALAGGARRVVQLDRNRRFLHLAKESYALNGYPVEARDFIHSDFFTAIGELKRLGESFDCVIIDPPYFSTTARGRVDQELQSARLINKVRPLINHGGYLVAINNALYVSGREYMTVLQGLCRDGYLGLRELIPVPRDFAGYNLTGPPITDPAPFNYSTKIAILDVRRKQISGRRV